MSKSREKSSKARFVVFGVILGLTLAGATAFLTYQLMAGDLKSKVRYALIKGKEHAVNLMKEKKKKKTAQKKKKTKKKKQKKQKKQKKKQKNNIKKNNSKPIKQLA